MFSDSSPDARVPEGHPLRPIKRHADAVLGTMNAEFDRIYAEIGRPSIPPERLPKASLLIALYSVRSDRLFRGMLDDDILFRWFLDMGLEESGPDQSNFSRLRERLVGQDTARMFFNAVAGEARTTRHAGDAVGQRKRKRVEEIFGWMKAYGGLRRTLVRALARVQMRADVAGAACNLLRMSRLSPGTR